MPWDTIDKPTQKRPQTCRIEDVLPKKRESLVRKEICKGKTPDNPEEDDTHGSASSPSNFFQLVDARENFEDSNGRSSTGTILPVRTAGKTCKNRQSRMSEF